LEETYAPACELMHVHEDIVDKVKDEMPDIEKLYDLAEFFKVFGDCTRIRILQLLFQSEMCVCDIATLLGAGQSAVSHQLRLLKQMRLVKFRKEGKTVFYSLADDHIKTIMDQGMEHINEERQER
jgi:DNA-binding transcriptional ArsR family regulator